MNPHRVTQREDETLARVTKAIAALYTLVFSFAYLGFILHRSDVPRLGRYSLSYLAFLAVLALGFLPPAAMRFVRRNYGARWLTFALLPAILLFVVVYFAASTYYYYSETHSFDPYLQAPTPSPSFSVKSRATFRILALGGSTTREITLPENDRYPRLLQDLLQRNNPALTVEVFNAGMDWFTSKHSLINYVTNLRDWQPDVVIVMHAFNDLYRSFSDPDVTVGPYNRLWSHFYGPSIRGAKPPTFEKYLLEHSAAYWFSDVTFATYKERNTPLERYVSLQDFRRNLGYLVHYLKSDGVGVVLMTEPFLYKDPMTDEERAVLLFGKAFCKERTSVLGYEYPSPSSLAKAMDAFNAATKEIGLMESVKVIDLESKIAKNLENFFDDMHYRVKGAHRVAEVVAGEIQETGLVQLARP